MRRKGQSMVEYLLIFGSVLAAVIVFATTTLRTKLGTSLDGVAAKMETKINAISFGQ